MRLKLISSILFSLFFCLLSSQVPKGFNYQAIARDGVSGNPITDPIDVRFTIRSDSVTGTVFWVEEHYNVDPDDNGLFNVVVGKGTRISGLTYFSDIDWTVTPKYLMMHINDGTWKLLGSTRMWTVPYAMVADSLGGPLAKLSVKGTTTDLEEPLFEVKNNSGQTVFAVYNEGVRIYVDKGAKGSKGGFAVSGFGFDKDANADQYLFVSRDSVRVYLDSNPATKAVKGGFAVSGFDYVKGVGQNLLDISIDSVRVYIDEDDGKALKGGFAVSSFAGAKAAKGQYLKVSSASTNIQVTDTLNGFTVANINEALPKSIMNIDKVNSFIGHETGPLNTPSTTGEGGKYNVFVGYQSGNKNVSGYKNVFLGYRAGLQNSSAEHNTYIGTLSGVLNETGRYNTFLGSQAGAYTTVSENTFIGYSAGVLNETGAYNTFLGTNSGAFHTTGNYNTYLGWGSGNNNSGNNNVFVGASSGSSNSGSGNVYIGYNTNKYSTMSSSNRLTINNYNGSSNLPLIYGEFDNRRVVINGIHTDNPSNYTFYVNGTAGGDASWNSLSDARFKKNIVTIPDALSKVLAMRGVNFEWKDPDALDNDLQIGFIAQEVEGILPEVVTKSDESYMIQYAPVTALLVEALKEQQKIISGQQASIDKLSNQLEMVINELNELKKFAGQNMEE